MQQAVVITQILGRVSSSDPQVLCTGEPDGNSTRWVFDVEQNAWLKPRFSFQPRSWRGRELVASTVSLSMTPLSASFWDAKPYIEKLTLPDLIVCAQELREMDKIRYRIAIDLVHSTSR